MLKGRLEWRILCLFERNQKLHWDSGNEYHSGRNVYSIYLSHWQKPLFRNRLCSRKRWQLGIDSYPSFLKRSGFSYFQKDLVLEYLIHKERYAPLTTSAARFASLFKIFPNCNLNVSSIPFVIRSLSRVFDF
jgi:hypothetical protein